MANIITSTQAAYSKIILTNSNGDEIISLATTKSYSSVLISAPNLILNETYILTAGLTTKQITLTSLIYGSTAGGMGGIGGRPGRP